MNNNVLDIDVLRKEEFIYNVVKKANAPVFIYGMGNGAEKLKLELDRHEIEIAGVFASDEFVRGQIFLGYKVVAYKDIPKDAVVLLAFGAFDLALLNRFEAMAKEHLFLVPDLPLFGEEYFNVGELFNRIEEIKRAYALLADDISRKVFLNSILYKISGKGEYLRQCETPRDEIFHSLIHLKENEVFLDCGAYDGDTVREFQQRTNSVYEKIIAVEPDAKNYKKLVNKTENAVLLNIGIFDYKGEISFSTEASRNSSISQEGKRIIAVDTVDNICKEEAVTFIKLDVEGSEKKALEGAVYTLKEKAPKMIVSAYHKTWDFYELLLQINEINPNYRLYMRHQPYLPNWETNIIAIV